MSRKRVNIKYNPKDFNKKIPSNDNDTMKPTKINTIISRGYWGHSNFETSIREVTPIDED